MSDVDWWARSVSALALGVSAAGFYLSYRTYTRAGADVTLRFASANRRGFEWASGRAQSEEVNVILQVTNRGLAPVHVRTFTVHPSGRRPGDKYGVVFTLKPREADPALPFELGALQTEFWAWDLSNIVAGLGPRQRKLEATARLSDGRTATAVLSGWTLQYLRRSITRVSETQIQRGEE